MANDDRRLDLSRDQEIWGIALWVDRKHGENGWFHISTERDRLLNEGDYDGVALWKLVEERWSQLQRAKGCPQ